MKISFLKLLLLRVHCVRRVIGVQGRRFSRSIVHDLGLTSHGLRRGRAFHCLRDFTIRGVGCGSSLPSVCVINKHVFSRNGIFKGSSRALTSFRVRAIIGHPTAVPGILHVSENGSVSRTTGAFHRCIGGTCICRGKLLSRIVCSVLCATDSGPLRRQVGFGLLSRSVHGSLRGGNVDVPCRFAISAGSNHRICHYPSCRRGKRSCSCARVLFEGSPTNGVKILQVRFPSVEAFLVRASHVVVPTLTFAVVLFIAFICAVCIVFVRGGIARVGGSFVGGVARRFGAPVSSVSLTTRVLGSRSVGGDRTVCKGLTEIVGSRAGHLHFRIRGVLRVSLCSHSGVTFGPVRLSTRRLLSAIVGAFVLGISRGKNSVSSSFGTRRPSVCISRVRFAGIVFGLVSGTIGCGHSSISLRLAVGA